MCCQAAPAGFFARLGVAIKAPSKLAQARRLIYSREIMNVEPRAEGDAFGPGLLEASRIASQQLSVLFPIS
jgi:hypothetical protein